MRKFATLMGIAIQGKLYYRLSFFLNLVTPLILLGGQFLLWNSIYGLRQGEALGEYGRAEMFSYILIAFAINNLLTWSSENSLSREIRSGSVISRCLRPAPFVVQSLADMTGNMALQAVVNFLAVGAGFALFHRRLVVPDFRNLGLFLVSLALAVLLRMLLVSLFSLLCFFTTSHLGLTWTRTALTDFFSGAVIPVSLFPLWLRTVSYYTPFPLMLQVPISIFLGEPLPMPLPAAFGMQCLWILAFLGLHQLLYGKIRRNLTLAGG